MFLNGEHKNYLYFNLHVTDCYDLDYYTYYINNNYNEIEEKFNQEYEREMHD